MKINDLRVELTNHAEDRLKERGVSLQSIAYILHDKYKTIKLYNNTGKVLCYISGLISMFFKIQNKCIKIITILDHEANYYKNAIVV